jgi:hypothetical protein
MEIIPWKCHICSGEFNHSSGGACFRCEEITCIDHLNLVGYKEKDGEARSDQIVCNKCLNEGESYIKFKKRFLLKSSRARLLSE